MPIVARTKLIGVTGSVTLLAFAAMLPARQEPATKVSEGEAIFAKSCAPCHGDKGAGGSVYEKPLHGDKSLATLTEYVFANMPPKKERRLTKEDAAKVSAYIYDAFYSPIAQERNRPARIALSRLTVKQFKNAVTDLLEPWQPVIPKTDKRGLKAMYFKGRTQEDKDKGLERADPTVDFDFAAGTPPGTTDFDPYNFTIVWSGAIIAPDTGDFEFILKSNQAVRLWINDQPKPVVDGWVKSSNETETTGTIPLLAGHAYNIRLEFSKATNGVDDDKTKKKSPPTAANVSLLWKRPRMAAEVVPTQYLVPEWTPSRFVVDTPFPADDRSIGYERGTSISKDWDEATTAAALDAADYVVNHHLRWIQDTKKGDEQKKLIDDFLVDFVQRAFGHGLTPDEKSLYIDKQLAGASDMDLAFKRIVVLTLKSPRFLYRGLGEKPDAFAHAAQLSFGLWDTTPPPELMQACWQGNLNTPEQIRAMAEKMVDDPRAWTKAKDFLLTWLKVDEVPDIVKNEKLYPGFDDHTVSDLRTSLEWFLQDNFTKENSDYRQLFLGKKQFLNARLAKIYGGKTTGDGFEAVELDAGKRAGVLTHPYLLARLAYLENSSPIHRGVLITRSFLGRTLNPPPQAFVPLAASTHPNLTTRERVAMQTKPAPCTGCHSMINPLGFTLEKFDAIGRIRDKENGKAVDASGSYVTRTGTTVKFKGATDLAQYLATSEEAQKAFIEKLFHAIAKQPVLAYGPDTLEKLHAQFKKDDYSIRKLMVAIAVETCKDKAE